jgi:hypothetical protein
MIKKLLSKLFTRETKDEFPRTYMVKVWLEHPQLIGGSAQRFYIAIDAESHEHARRRLATELRIKVGKSRLVRLKPNKK